MQASTGTKTLRFAATGVLATLTHVFIATLMMATITRSPVIANTVAFTGATVLSYVVNSRWSFSGHNARGSLQRYLVVSLAGLIMSAIISSLGETMGLHYLAGILLVLMVVPPIIFLLHSNWTYKVTTQTQLRRHDHNLQDGLLKNLRRPADEMFFLLASVAATIPVWVAVFPPMTDLPQHAAQISLYHALQDPSFAFANLFTVNLFTPYLFGYGVIAILVPAFGIVIACKIAISLALAATPLATRFLLREVGADPYLAWLSFPALYGFAYQWGFVNFLIAAPLGLLALAFIWRQDRHPSLGTSLLIALLFNFLFFCHALALGLFGVIAALFWICRERSIKSLIAHAWPLATVLPAVIIWLLNTNSHPAVRVPNDWDLGWFSTSDEYYSSFATWIDPNSPGWGRINGLFSRLLGIRSQLIGTVFGIAIALLPFAIARFRYSLLRSVPLAVCIVVLLLVPSFIFGTAFIYQRFSQYLLPFYLFLFLPVKDAPNSTKNRIARILPPVIAFLWIGMMAHRAFVFDHEARDFEQAIADIPKEKRVFSLIFLREDSSSISPTFIHFPAWYSALKNGVVDKSFAVTQVQPVVYRPEAAQAAAILGYEWIPEAFSWRTMQGDKYDYFIVRADADLASALFAEAPCPPREAARITTWWIYQRDDAACTTAKKN